MSGLDKSGNEHVKCDVCLKEVPGSGVKSVETSDYVAHFCGLDCYQKWMQKAEHEKKAGRF